MMDCYVGMGGNFAETLSVMRQVAIKLKKDPELHQVLFSKLYLTSPVSDIPQADFLNAVCRFQTDLSLDALWEKMQNLEKEMGKTPSKIKHAPRVIDLDLLFYGPVVTTTDRYTVPHPRWHERLFVLAPLADVTEEIPIGLNVQELLQKFTNPHQEKISIYKESL